MSLLLSMSGWDPEPWAEAFRDRLPTHRVVLPADSFAPDDVRYAATWKHEPGALARYPNLQAIMCSAIHKYRRSRWCGSSIPICAIA